VTTPRTTFSNRVADARGNQCRIRQATPDDLPAIRALFRMCFGFEQPQFHFRSKFFQASVGTSIVMIAEQDGRLIGHYALWGIPLRLGFELIAGAQSVDTMTHPEYRRRGVLVRLATAAMDIAVRRGIEVVYGFPNEGSLTASVRRLNWHQVGNVQTFMRPLRPEGMRRIPKHLHVPTRMALRVWPTASTAGYDICDARPSDGAIALLLQNRAPADGACQTERSPQWYDWRFSHSFGRDYRWLTLESGGGPAAFAVWGRDTSNGNGLLADVVAVDDNAYAAAVAAVIDRARQANCAAVGTMTTRPEILRALRANGFRRHGNLPFKVRALTGRVLGANIYQPEAWRLLGADCDSF
jgi:predicted N-acetyltransferase YhbS